MKRNEGMTRESRQKKIAVWVADTFPSWAITLLHAAGSLSLSVSKELEEAGGNPDSLVSSVSKTISMNPFV